MVLYPLISSPSRPPQAPPPRLNDSAPSPQFVATNFDITLISGGEARCETRAATAAHDWAAVRATRHDSARLPQATVAGGGMADSASRPAALRGACGGGRHPSVTGRGCKTRAAVALGCTAVRATRHDSARSAQATVAGGGMADSASWPVALHRTHGGGRHPSWEETRRWQRQISLSILLRGPLVSFIGPTETIPCILQQYKEADDRGPLRNQSL